MVSCRLLQLGNARESSISSTASPSLNSSLSVIAVNRTWNFTRRSRWNGPSRSSLSSFEMPAALQMESDSSPSRTLSALPPAPGGGTTTNVQIPPGARGAFAKHQAAVWTIRRRPSLRWHPVHLPTTSIGSTANAKTRLIISVNPVVHPPIPTTPTTAVPSLGSIICRSKRNQQRERSTHQ